MVATLGGGVRRLLGVTAIFLINHMDSVFLGADLTRDANGSVGSVL